MGDPYWPTLVAETVCVSVCTAQWEVVPVGRHVGHGLATSHLARGRSLNKGRGWLPGGMSDLWLGEGAVLAEGSMEEAD